MMMAMMAMKRKTKNETEKRRKHGDGGGDHDDVGDDGEEVPQFYIYKLPIVRLSGCYWLFNIFH